MFSLICPVLQIFVLIQSDGFPSGSDGKDGKESACNVGDLGSIPGSGISPGGGHSNPLQYSCLENPMDREAWWATVCGVTKNWTWLRTWLSDFPFTFHLHVLEKEMATHSSVLAWRIPGTREPGGLSSVGLHRVRHDWSDLAAAAAETYTHTCLLGSESWWLIQARWFCFPELRVQETRRQRETLTAWSTPHLTQCFSHVVTSSSSHTGRDDTLTCSPVLCMWGLKLAKTVFSLF